MKQKWHCNLLTALLALFFLTLVCTGCEHRPLEDMFLKENIFVKIYFDEAIRNVSYGFYDESKKRPDYSSPQSVRVMFFENAIPA